MPDEGSVDEILYKANALIEKEKKVKKAIKDSEVALHNNTKAKIESLTSEEAYSLLNCKWIEPIVNAILLLPESSVSALINSIMTLTKKYSVSLVDLDDEISLVSKELVAMIDELEGDDFDMKGLNELQKMLMEDYNG